MPLTRFVADVVGVVTICLIALLILLGLICILYSLYFRYRINSQGLIQLNYFNGPWIIRITFILFAIWWGLGEIVRLSFLRQEGRILNTVNLEWQETVCKSYIISSMGFAEPCLFLTLAFLLRAPLQKVESGVLSQKWNGKTLRFIIAYCFPVFFLQLIAILAGPKLSEYNDGRKLLPDHFTRAAYLLERNGKVAVCTYPLLSTIISGVFATVLTIYLMWTGKRILNLVINKILQKRIYTVIPLVAVCLPLRYILLGLTALSNPVEYLFEALAFLAFITPLCSTIVCTFILVYCPVADSMALGSLQDLEARRRLNDNQNDVTSIMANQSHLEASSRNSSSRISGASTKTESISFRTDDRSAAFVELSLFSPSRDELPQFQGWPIRPVQPPPPPPAEASTSSLPPPL